MTLTGTRAIATVFGTDIVQVGVRFVLGAQEAEDAPVAAGGTDPLSKRGYEATVLGDAIVPDEVIEGVRWRHVWVSVEIPREQEELDVRFSCDHHGRVVHLAKDELRRLRDEFAARRLPIEADGGYDPWFRAHRATEAELAEQRRVQSSLPARPLFSVIVPLYHTPVDFFDEMAASVLQQTYDKFELILVNSTPGDADLAAAVAALAARDGRVRVVELERNLGITENTNAGIDVARGDFVAFFDHDDVLEPEILFHYAAGIARDPEVDLLYCDEDKLEDGRYVFPSFKPDFSLMLLETNNYVCHMLTVRRSLLNSLPRASAAYDGAQDHRLTLVASERLRHVFHARRILYHWRVSATSTAGNSEAKPESLEAGRRAIEEHVRRLGVPAHVENVPTMAHCYETILNKEAPMPGVGLMLMGTGVDSPRIGELAADGVEVRAVGHLASRAERVQAVNKAVRESACEYLVLSDGEVELPLPTDLLRRLYVVCVRDGVGVVGAKSVLPDGTKVGGAYAFTSDGPVLIDRYFPEGDHQARGYEVFPHEVSAVDGNCIMMRRDLLVDMGGIDAGMGRFWSIDLCLRAAGRGLSTVEVPMAMVKTTLDRTRMGCFTTADEALLLVDRANLMERWPEAFVSPSPYYSDVYDSQGYYGLDRKGAAI